MNKPTKGIIVDGYCKGNPGKGGYRGIDIETGEVLFKHDLVDICTNNISEYLGLVHAIMYVKKSRIDRSIYTDSEIAMAWVNLKSCGTKMTPIGKTLGYMLWKCDVWLSEQKTIPHFNKWHTHLWGENPADFGNK